MNKIDRAKNFIYNLFTKSSHVFYDNGEDVAISNYITLRKMTVFYLGCLMLYAFIMDVLIGTKFTTLSHNILILCAFIVQIAFSVTVFLFHNKKTHYRLVRFLCMSFAFLIMAFTIILGIFITPTATAYFFIPMLVCMSTIYTLAFRDIFSAISIYYAIFIVLCCVFIKDEILITDTLGASIAYLVAIANCAVTSELRVNDFISKKQLTDLATVDQLTEINNKLNMENLCNKYINELTDGERFSFAIIDVDDFKDLNDSFGHQKGDLFLKLLGSFLARTANKYCDSSVIGRFGGDEFCVLFKNCTLIDTLSAFAKEFLDGIEKIGMENFNRAFHCSMGIAVCKQGITYASVFEKADAAMYRVKSGGKNNFFITD